MTRLEIATRLLVARMANSSVVEWTEGWIDRDWAAAGRLLELDAKAAPAGLQPAAAKRWKPEEGASYWCVSALGEIDRYIWDNHRVDHGFFAIGNVHPSEEAAKASPLYQFMQAEKERLAKQGEA